jgi:hypothetical protein
MSIQVGNDEQMDLCFETSLSHVRYQWDLDYSPAWSNKVVTSKIVVRIWVRQFHWSSVYRPTTRNSLFCLKRSMLNCIRHAWVSWEPWLVPEWQMYQDIPETLVTLSWWRWANRHCFAFRLGYFRQFLMAWPTWLGKTLIWWGRCFSTARQTTTAGKRQRKLVHGVPAYWLSLGEFAPDANTYAVPVIRRKWNGNGIFGM